MIKAYVLAGLLFIPTCVSGQEQPPNSTVAVTASKSSADSSQHTGCNMRGFARETWAKASTLGRGLANAPRAAIRPSNLKWELPVLATTGILIAKVDRPAANRIQSKSLQQTANLWSNVGLGLE